MRCTALTSILVCVLSSIASGTTYVVRPDGSGDFPTIQAAINAAVDGDIIELSDGTFTGNGNRDVRFSGKAVTVRSQSGDAETCVIDCDGFAGEEHRGFSFFDGEGPGSILQDVTIRHGNAPFFEFFPLDRPGGAILCSDSSPTIDGCILSDNVATLGGGIGLAHGAAPIVRECVIVRNQAIGEGLPGGAGAGGGVGTAGVGECLISDCVIGGNEAGDVGGGMLAMWGGRVTMSDCEITGNVADRFGGGVVMWQCDGVMAGTTISGNRGGGLTCAYDAVSIERSILWGNCRTGSASGHEVVALNAVVSLTCCDVDSTGVLGRSIFFVDDNVFVDPAFCDPASCGEAPTTGGDYTLDAASICLPGASPCGQLIGALGQGCTGPVPTQETTWGRIKGQFRR